jgi:diamine N-acetyltransferase
MYEVVDDQGPFLTASIYRFMIDRRQQGKGHGRAALAELLKEIQSIPGVKKISICYMASNHQAKQFYANFGFREVGRDRDGETIAELNISAPNTFERNL